MSLFERIILEMIRAMTEALKFYASGESDGGEKARSAIDAVKSLARTAGMKVD